MTTINTIKTIYKTFIEKISLYFIIIYCTYICVGFSIIKLASMAFNSPLNILVFIFAWIFITLSWVYVYFFNNEAIDYFLVIFFNKFFMNYVKNLMKIYLKISQNYPMFLIGFMTLYILIVASYFLKIYVFHIDPTNLPLTYSLYNKLYFIRFFFIMPIYIYVLVTTHPQFSDLFKDYANRNPSFEATLKTVIYTEDKAMENMQKQALAIAGGVAGAGVFYDIGKAHIGNQKKLIQITDDTLGEARKVFGISEENIPEQLRGATSLYNQHKMEAKYTYNNTFRGVTSDGAAILKGEKTSADKVVDSTLVLIGKYQETHAQSGVPDAVPVPSQAPTIVPSVTPNINMPKEESLLDSILNFIAHFI